MKRETLFKTNHTRHAEAFLKELESDYFKAFNKKMTNTEIVFSYTSAKKPAVKNGKQEFSLEMTVEVVAKFPNGDTSEMDALRKHTNKYNKITQ
jgi:hypothetical protein